MNTPASYGLPHKTWRKHQLDSVHWAEDINGVGILEAPTGSGKTAIPTALGNSQRVVSLVRTKSLQQESYGNLYQWSVLFGQGNHPCNHPDNFHGATAEDCLFGVMMNKCDEAADCSYLIDKHAARKSNRASLNFAYSLVSLKRWPRFDWLAMDEAHLASEIVLDFVGIKLHEGHRKTWGLPRFPRIGEPRPFSSEHHSAAGKMLDWLKAAGSVLDIQLTILIEDSAGTQSPIFSSRLKRCKRLLYKIDSATDVLENNPRDWFIRAGKKAVYHRGAAGGILARPLTARHDFNRLFHADNRLLMSATIGDTGAFTEELGIRDFAYRRVPNQFTPEQRPIYILDAPRMGRKATTEDFERQADVIADAIKSCPPDWSGIIHVTRKTEARFMTDRLASRGLEDRVWPMTGHDGTQTPTNQQIEDWKLIKTQKPGAICISWSMFEGYDGLDERICIVAKVPFPFLGDEYERARMKYSHRFYNWRTGCKLSQGLGRTRRGRKQDYDLNGTKQGLVAIADGNWTRVKKYLSQDVLEAIVL